MAVLLSFALLVATAGVDDEQPLPFFGAKEKWVCTFQGFGTSDKVTSYFGVYKTHVEDNWGSDNVIAQNDASALVFVGSSVGEVDYTGKVIRSALISIIDKKSRLFKRTNVELHTSAVEVEGTCAPY